ncbi:uncharacterized protein LOC132633761 [Lycium barbarum]|uniref:uncharacterized protein LOC132633761 n=1 Tax=Lycium barbarum TaxID=112863 RepID=UPI00293F610B|nr:uncharacterized protein LOC132633761 [Lycium barbarum]
MHGNTLRFGIREYALVTGSKCYEDDNTVYDEPEVNRLLKEYFPRYGKESITRESLLDHFKQKGWKSDEDALKMAILVFIHHFLFSDANKHSILKKDFDIVESGQCQRYAWGIKVFEDMFRTIMDKLRAKLMMYRLGGLPLAFQVWFYECCSTVDKTLLVLSIVCNTSLTGKSKKI